MLTYQEPKVQCHYKQKLKDEQMKRVETTKDKI
jgi:hypothetical protein